MKTVGTPTSLARAQFMPISPINSPFSQQFEIDVELQLWHRTPVPTWFMAWCP